MGDVNNLFSPEDLNRLSIPQKQELVEELERQLDAAPEIREIIENQRGSAAHEAANRTLFQRMAPILQRLGLER
jgi:hypothetical protein